MAGAGLILTLCSWRQKTSQKEFLHNASCSRTNNLVHRLAKLQATMTNNGSRFSLYSSRAALLLFVLLQANAVSAFQQPQHHPCCWSAPAQPAMTMLMTSSTSTSLKVSTIGGDWDMLEDEQQDDDRDPRQRARSLLHRQLQLRAAAAKANNKTKPLAASLAPELELPRHTVTTAAEQQPITMMATAERMLGRVSMVAAFVLVANELLTGQSLPDQIVSVLTMTMSN